MTRSPALGQEKRVTLRYGDVRYFERGEGRPVVFVHGALVNADLWRHVVPDLAAAGFRCLSIDLPLGAHEVPLRPDADLSPTGVADLIADFLDALDLRDVLLVANDTGGALTQIMLSRRPERVGSVVLTPSDCFDHFFPPLFQPLVPLAHIPGSMRPVAALLQVKALHRMPFVFGWVTKYPIPAEFVESYVRPAHRDAAIRRDLRKFLRGVRPKYTLEAAEKLRAFDKPVLLVWADEDRTFPLRLGKRLAATLPNARLVEVADSYAFVPEDQPAELVRHILAFAGVMAD
ncbi:alpha/beta fold hydrolase [Amycolatopsis thermoflava]|uniref:Pimeloyl-ACP methyl ester carboxylesterase n=2 Tax=Amycolatopsis thermoflava TaxID=84480 RepID=A0A3N2GVC7_9PSEU|nr:alpha/beta hydrolase [Amycolatopsis thermoflava]ROS40507.1 pimeloyl-ACP methyl ester carboxylesterase [Amycolatopsis thermoflava]